MKQLEELAKMINIIIYMLRLNKARQVWQVKFIGQESRD
jgi:hypothetical protein